MGPMCRLTRERGEPGPDSQLVVRPFVLSSVFQLDSLPTPVVGATTVPRKLLSTIVTHECSRTVRGHSPIHQEKHDNILTIIPNNPEQG